ncbi:MAG TPA: caspase family protein [Bacillota bacterium]|nr:caspase family protein [Bacillota bacterium]
MTAKALITGINKYMDQDHCPNLNGCVNDARDIAHTLNALGIVPPKPSTLKIITNERATKANILEGLHWLIDGSKKGDTLIFYYSGHGTQVPDLDGDDFDEKAEAICPHDFVFDKPDKLIKDDDLQSIFSDLAPGVNLEVILDSCFSGDGTRALVGPEEEKISYRHIDLPLDHSYFIDTHPNASTKSILKPASGDRGVVYAPKLNHVLWAACHEYQRSAEGLFDGVYRGVFTYWFCTVLRKAGKETTRNKLISLVSADIKKIRKYDQIPQLEGTKESINEKIFT